MTPSEHSGAVTTQQAVDGHREHTMKIAIVENKTWNWVSISLAGSVEVVHGDFSVMSVRDDMRHIIGSSEPDIIFGSDKVPNRGYIRKYSDHMQLLFES